jgi:hypothetical protein
MVCQCESQMQCAWREQEKLINNASSPQKQKRPRPQPPLTTHHSASSQQPHHAPRTSHQHQPTATSQANSQLQLPTANCQQPTANSNSGRETPKLAPKFLARAAHTAHPHPQPPPPPSPHPASPAPGCWWPAVATGGWGWWQGARHSALGARRARSWKLEVRSKSAVRSQSAVDC